MSDLWDLPFKGNDFDDNERVCWGAANHSGGIQKYGYDLTGAHYDAKKQTWLEYSNSGDVNKDFYLYGIPVYAMQDGKIIAGWRNAPENPVPFNGVHDNVLHEEITKYEGNKSRIYGGGNGVWIQHADGTRAEYAHFQPSSLPSELCPHNDELLPEVIASTNVSDAWKHIKIPVNKQKTVKKGDFLGRVGNAGTSSHPHLHVHRENGGTADATKTGGEAVKINFSSGLSGPKSNSDDVYVKWTSFAGKPIPTGPILLWPSRTRTGEHARHGQTLKDFGLFFDHFADSGLWPEWIDLYSVKGEIFVNQIWRQAKAGWSAFAGLDAAAYQKAFDDNKKNDMFPVWVESATSGGTPFYAAVFVHKKSGSYRARHGLSYDEHMAEMDTASKKGLSPVSISVVSVAGERDYTDLYRSNGWKGWVIKSRILEDDYQDEYKAQSKKGRKPVYLNSYMHGGKPYIAAIFAQVSVQDRRDRHKMSGSKYQSEYSDATAAGMATRAVTSFDGAKSQHRYAAVWWK